MKEYFSTIEAAKYCKVTRFTIINWIIKGILSAQKTAGGHHRILFSDLTRFMREYKMDLSSLNLHSPETGFKWCWEYHQKDGYQNHKCLGCLVYLTHARKCFELRDKMSGKRIFCNSECKNCSYYKDYSSNFQWCWEFHQENGCDHECRECIVYVTGTRRCFTLRKETDHKKIFCKKDCMDCLYYKTMEKVVEPQKYLY